MWYLKLNDLLRRATCIISCFRFTSNMAWDKYGIFTGRSYGAFKKIAFRIFLQTGRSYGAKYFTHFHL
jgi:hypothetical protein